jgi:hypothetical protein
MLHSNAHCAKEHGAERIPSREVARLRHHGFSINNWEMVTLLNERNVPLRYTAEDAESDLKTLKEVDP